MKTSDNGQKIITGNQRVLRARLSDAKFFWETDLRVRLDSRLPALADRLFYAGLGNLHEKALRISALAGQLAAALPGADPVMAHRAGLLCKADLSSEMVGEFPELQGIMGRYYAQKDGEDAGVAQAIAEHYAPQGPADRCPQAVLSVAVSLADKIDTLVGFFALGEKPTGSKDPFALRRAALGIIRLILENKVRLSLVDAVRSAFALYHTALPRSVDEVVHDILDFFADRLKVYLREKGVRHDWVSAVFGVQTESGYQEDDLVRLMARVVALGDFLGSDDGQNLLIAFRRAANIVRIEEKKDECSYHQPSSADYLSVDEEKALFHTLQDAEKQVSVYLRQEDFVAAMAGLAEMRSSVDHFFEKVTVNCDDASMRQNRLRLLAQIVTLMGKSADFSKIEG